MGVGMGAVEESTGGGGQGVDCGSAPARRNGRLAKAGAALLAVLSAALALTTLMASQRPGPAGAPTTRDVLDELSALDMVHSAAEKKLAGDRLEDLADDLRLGRRSTSPPASIFSTPSVGIFTGHSHRKKGGKLRFGKGTYFNVFNPDPNQSDCDPGFYGASGNSCVECPEGNYCPGGREKKRCPERSTSFPGSYKPDDCYCQPGTFGNRPGMCSTCPANSYCPGGKVVTACPAHSSSAPEAFACKCNKGYFGEDGTKCVKCPQGSFCPGGAKTFQCPAHTSSQPGATGLADCACVAGFYELAPVGEGAAAECFECPRDMYCPGGRLTIACPPHTTAPLGSKRMEQCVCAGGYYGDDSQNCKKCPAGSYCEGFGREPKSCPPRSSSPPGVNKVSQCECLSGYVGSDPNSCSTCPAGSYCPGGSVVITCPARSTSDEGSSKCRCKEGFFGTDAYHCFACPVGSFCPGGSSVSKCPAHTSSGTGAKRELDCECLPGFKRNDRGTCDPCPAGSFCPTTGGEPQDCPAHSDSDTGSDAASDCECVAGYSQFNGRAFLHKSAAGPQCFACAAGSYCLGGRQRLVCPPKTTSEAKSDERRDCTCKAGFYGDSLKCAQCPRGSYCEGGGEARQCPSKATSGKGAARADLCSCDKGYYGSYDACKACPAGSFCTGGKTFKKCPGFSTSKPGSSACSCKAGFYGSDPRRCVTCQKGYYCSGALERLKCPTHSTSPKGARSLDQCKCNPGYTRVKTGDVFVCKVCPEGSYCPGHSVMHSCPAYKTSVIGSRSLSRCGCAPGFKDSGTVPSSNYYWVFEGKAGVAKGGKYQVCTTSDDGSFLYVDGTLRVNNDGLHGARRRCANVDLQPGVHAMKATGFQRGGGVYMRVMWSGPDTNYKLVHMNVAKVDGNPEDYGKGLWKMEVFSSKKTLVRTPTDTSKLKKIGTAKVKDIQFSHLNHFRKYMRGDCVPCAPGHYCPGGFYTHDAKRNIHAVPWAHQFKCPNGRWTVRAGAVAAKDCNACGPGYYGARVGECKACQRGHFCPGGGAMIKCPHGSTTHHHARTDVKSCYCSPGYFLKDKSGPSYQCKPCTPGYYCPYNHGKQRIKCPSGATSPAGSRVWSQCRCPAGKYRHGNSQCLTCPQNTYCTGNNRLQRCPANAYADKGSRSKVSCGCKKLDANYPRQYRGQSAACDKYDCRKRSLCQLQMACDRDSLCRGFVFPSGTPDVGVGCKLRGLSKCINTLEASDNTLYVRKTQIPDTVNLLRRLRLKVPQCNMNGPKVQLLYNCWGTGWKGALLPAGDWAFTSWQRCDNDRDLCQVNNCRVHGGHASAVTVPDGMQVTMYTQRNFGGESVTLRGRLSKKCLLKVRDRKNRAMTNRVWSVKIR